MSNQHSWSRVMFIYSSIYTIGDTTRHEIFKFLHVLGSTKEQGWDGSPSLPCWLLLQRRVGLVLVYRPRDPFRFRALRLYGNPKGFLNTIYALVLTELLYIFSLSSSFDLKSFKWISSVFIDWKQAWRSLGTWFPPPPRVRFLQASSSSASAISSWFWDAHCRACKFSRSNLSILALLKEEKVASGESKFW
jgi:hypothetical protein